MLRISALLAVLALSCACPPPAIERDAGPDGEGEGEGDIDEDAVPADEYCERIVDFFCPYYLRCGRMAAADVDECTSVFLESCNARFEPSFASLAAASLLSLSQSGIDACSAHLSDVACEEQLLDLDGPCASMWKGKQPAGAPCGFDLETFVCAPGTACVLDVTFCGVCEQIVDDGAGCTVGEVTCARESSCEDGTCTPRARVGEACSLGERCVLGSICSDEGVCEGPTYVGVDDACDFENRCPFHSECLGAVCTLSASLGDACDAAPCEVSGFCEADTDTCVELVAQGGACDQGAQCQTGVCAEGACSILPSACIPP